MAVSEDLHPPADAAADHLRGGPRPAVTLVEYGDYECPYSRRAFRNIQRAERQLGDELAFVFRHFPLTSIHPHALAAARAAEAAAAQDAFWKMHETLFHRQQSLADEDLRAYAHELGLDLDRFYADRASAGVLERISRDLESGRASGVQGTPTLYLNGRLYLGSYETEQLLPALRAHQEVPQA